MYERSIPQPGRFPDLLNQAIAGLVRTEHVIGTRTEIEPDGFLRWGMAHGEAIEARDALCRAPSLPPRIDTDHLSDVVPERESAASLGDLATEIEHALIRAAEQATDPDDKLACLDAALHVARLRQALE